eukprot:m.62229 g.62229  ORF g.62229 m.62229 type:complete len:74 (+) comp13925_c0_seq2:153-374(+)
MNLFRKRVQFEPGQVVRIAPETQPLWIGDRIPTKDEIRPCGHCNAPRSFVFQVLPQVLTFFQVRLREGDKACK